MKLLKEIQIRSMACQSERGGLTARISLESDLPDIVEITYRGQKMGLLSASGGTLQALGEFALELADYLEQYQEKD